VEDPSFSKKCPTVLEFLGCNMWPDQTPREPGTITLFIEGHRWKAGVNDRDGEFSAYLSAETFQGLLEALERGLDQDKLDWRPWKKSTGVAKKAK